MCAYYGIMNMLGGLWAAFFVAFASDIFLGNPMVFVVLLDQKQIHRREKLWVLLERCS